MHVQRVQLLVTGEMERRGLAASLARVFPTNGDGQPVTFTAVYQDSFTSSPVNPTADLSTIRKGVRYDSAALKMAKRLVASVVGPGKVDLMIAIDDLELANAHQPQVVVDTLRRAVVAATEALGRSSVDALVRQKCSFHLLAPMAEAYFFGHDAALHEACGPHPDVRSHLRSPNVEEFYTHDPAYGGDRNHPKQYVTFLAEKAPPRKYAETTEGVAALRALDWREATRDGAPFARALLRDLAEALGVEFPLLDGVESVETYPTKDVRRSSLTLRNL